MHAHPRTRRFCILSACAIALLITANVTHAQSSGLRIIRPNAGENYEKIETALSSITLVEFPGNPISDVMQFLQQQHDIPIMLDTPTLEKMGITSDDEVSLIIGHVSLRSAITLMLNEHGLGFIIDNEVLLITSKERVDNHFETRLYDLSAYNMQPVEGDELIAAITQTVAPETWTPATCGAAYFNGHLIISQTQTVHNRIENLLNGLLPMAAADKATE